MEARHSNEDYAVSSGGPLYNVFSKTRYFNTHNKIAVLGLCIAWLPLVIISAAEGTLYSGVQMPFLHDVAMQARVLIALPMMIIIKGAVDNKITRVLKFLGNELLDAEKRNLIINTTFRKAKQLSSSALTEIIILLVVIASTVSLVKSGAYSTLGSGTSWMAFLENGSQQLSVAGYWSVFISIPLCQYFILRWLWRYIVWVILLFRFSKADINLLPTHADKAGGVGIILMAQHSFCLFFVALSVILSGELMANLLNHPDEFNAIRGVVVGYIVICLIVLLFPLLFFSGKLMKTKNEGLLHLGNLSTGLSRKFEREWVNDLSVDKILEQQKVDPSLLYDYAGMYGLLQELRVVPVTVRDILGMALLLFVPFIPILFIHFSIAELLQRIAGMVL